MIIASLSICYMIAIELRGICLIIDMWPRSVYLISTKKHRSSIPWQLDKVRVAIPNSPAVYPQRSEQEAARSAAARLVSTKGNFGQVYIHATERLATRAAPQFGRALKRSILRSGPIIVLADSLRLEIISSA